MSDNNFESIFKPTEELYIYPGFGESIKTNNLVNTIYPYIKRMKPEKVKVYCNEETKNALQSLDKSDKIVFDYAETYDVVITNGNDLANDYSLLHSSGIFVGDRHNEIPVKEALGKFRREEKIGTPILVANGVYFWYKR
jgi:hypothetical protein